MEAKEIKFRDEKAKLRYNKLFRGRYEERELGNNIEKALVNIKSNVYCGIQIPKKLIPKAYSKNYKINNLWKYNLPNGWRLLYSIQSLNKITIIAVIIEYLDHKNYEKRFSYFV
ncbi:TPA: hypothetical protein HA235_01180 [Candidatus Woesearchaeota archaeon]|nr:hypothetical protein [Candidatus Woesearchaeota archaeon]HIH31296.1 hypothetical protein [Candidatus Woesearchaeota archaeon]HIH55413.1 hypothetical protein [Candidatus Woesearchaeota archaeon]HIJ01605.1 hypothetical protein [Candidatus Woesearchaeota archaeon]HIJ14604.1 hypothetical protein [Candidatus Woesearchaeota archaeon]